MHYRALACLVIAWAAPMLHAGPAETAIVDAMKLPDAFNYSWLTDVADDARSYMIEGKTDLVENKDFSLVTMPMVGAISRRLRTRAGRAAFNGRKPGCPPGRAARRA